jgi:hypothetical protein
VKTDLDPTIRLETQASEAHYRPRNDKIAQTQTKPPKNNQPESSLGCHHVVCALILHCPTGEPTRLLPSGSQMVQHPGIRRRQPAWPRRCDHRFVRRTSASKPTAAFRQATSASTSAHYMYANSAARPACCKSQRRFNKLVCLIFYVL